LIYRNAHPRESLFVINKLLLFLAEDHRDLVPFSPNIRTRSLKPLGLKFVFISASSSRRSPDFPARKGVQIEGQEIEIFQAVVRPRGTERAKEIFALMYGGSH
jgi:hypothetical protein